MAAGSSRRAWLGAGCLMTLAALALASAPACPSDVSASVGEKIYLQGVLRSGAPLKGERTQAQSTEGAAAACVGCHRRSGLGVGEGTIRVAPITSRFLYARAGVPAGLPTLDAAAASDANRVAYDDASLALAIRTGTGRGGHTLNYLMPRYALGDADMASLIAYLKQLPTGASAGVSDTTIELATIITPDADPVERDGMLAVLNQFVEDKNVFIRGGRRPLRTQEQINFRVTRRWRLHVWTLQGPAATWEKQLHAHLKEEPVFAVLSGIGGREWAPVHRFCQSERLPCLFPNVAAPVDAEQDFYSMYFSRGVLLEADLIGKRLGDDPAAHGGRLVQVYAAGGGAQPAVARLKALAPTGMESLDIAVQPGDAAGLARAMAEVRPGDSLVLWLERRELALLVPQPPVATAIYVSGTLGGLEQAPVPAAWRGAVHLAYPVDLPQARALRLTYPLKWMQIKQLPVVAERVQADTYLACGIMAEGFSEMLDSLLRDYLLERVESMLSHRQLSGYYPRLGLAPGQRFASKGGYFVHFTGPTGTAVSPEGEWIVP